MGFIDNMEVSNRKHGWMGVNVTGTLDASGDVVAGSGFMPSNYTADTTADSAASTREAIPSLSSAVMIRNLGPTNFARVIFGDSTITATVTTGIHIEADERLLLTVPPSATHWAFIADTADVTLNVTWQ